MRRLRAAAIALAMLAGAASGGVQAQNSTAPARAPLSRDLLHVQVILDHLGFPPGPLDGREGPGMSAALRAFQASRGLAATGSPDMATLRALHPHRALRPTRIVRLTADMLSGPFVSPWPRDPKAQARLPAMAYRSPLEKLAEMFHTTPKLLIELNSADTRLAPGVPVVVPDVIAASQDYPTGSTPEWRRTLRDLNVNAVQPRAARIVIDRSDKVLRVFDARGQLVAQFNATPGSRRTPVRVGRAAVRGVVPNPGFSQGGARPDGLSLPPGPNNPLGVVRIDLAMLDGTIHGTAEPQWIGRSEAEGGIRLTNWDVARLALMVQPGTPVIVQP